MIEDVVRINHVQLIVEDHSPHNTVSTPINVQLIRGNAAFVFPPSYRAVDFFVQIRESREALRFIQTIVPSVSRVFVDPFALRLPGVRLAV